MVRPGKRCWTESRELEEFRSPVDGGGELQEWESVSSTPFHNATTDVVAKLSTHHYCCVVLPDFGVSGFLPPGVHLATWVEIERVLGWNPWRRQLLVGLRQAAHALFTAGCQTLWIDGSFVSTKDDPADYDGCWDVAGVQVALLDPVLLDFSNRRRGQKAKYGGELFPSLNLEAISGLPFLEFFQLDHRTGDAKGILALELRGFRP